MKEIFL